MGASLANRSAAHSLCPLVNQVALAAAAGGASRLPPALLAWSVGGVRGPKASTRKVPVILLKDSPNLGYRGEEVSVRPGYARNFLIPQQLVVYSTHENKAVFLKENDAAEVISYYPLEMHGACQPCTAHPDTAHSAE